MTEWDKPHFMTFVCFTVNWRVYNDWIISSQLKDNILRVLVLKNSLVEKIHHGCITIDGVDTTLQRISEMRQRIPRFETSNKFYKFSIAHKNVRWKLNF